MSSAQPRTTHIFFIISIFNIHCCYQELVECKCMFSVCVCVGVAVSAEQSCVSVWVSVFMSMCVCMCFQVGVGHVCVWWYVGKGQVSGLRSCMYVCVCVCVGCCSSIGSSPEYWSLCSDLFSFLKYRSHQQPEAIQTHYLDIQKYSHRVHYQDTVLY